MRRRGRRRPGLESLEARRLLDGSMPLTNPVLQAEHQAVMNLVPEGSATIRSIRDGDWSDPKIWDIGRVPLAGDNVLISEHTGVRVDSVQPAALHTIRVDGTLRFATDRNSGLSVDTIVVTPDGDFEMGTPEAPISPNVKATVTFVGAGPIDTAWDPKQFSRGLISQGEFQVQGAETTAFLPLARTPRKGDTTLLLSTAPENWRVGQQLLLTGTNAYANEDEVLEIKGISGNVVTVQPLKFDHAAPLDSLTPYVANMSRNAVFQSADPGQIQLRGHVMIMHSPHSSVAYAGLYGLGRQDKSIAVNDPVLDSAGKLVPGTGTNPRGRYALHVHRTGLDGGDPVEVRGSVVWGSPGWGFVNHSSNVDFEDNVSFNVAGAGFASEAGDEIGSFNHNLAVRSTGTNAGMEIRQGLEDFGHQGVGFWLQGGGMKVTDNVAAGQRQSGFFFVAQGLIQAGLGTTTFPASNLPDPAWAQGRPTIEVKNVPMREFSGNEAFASGSGLDWWFSLMFATHSGRSVIDRMTIWNTRNAEGTGNGRGMILAYSANVTVRDSLIVGDPSRPFGIGVETNNLAHDMNFENLRVIGWNTGLKAPRDGQVNIRGGEYNNVTNIDIRSANSSRRDVNINGPFQFGTLSSVALAGRKQLDIALFPAFDGSARDISRMFDTLMVVNYDGRPMYYPEQAADFVPLKPGVAASDAPSQLVGKTNQQIWDEFGLAVGGSVAPASAQSNPRILGLIGDTRVSSARIDQVGYAYTNQLTGYRMAYYDASGRTTYDTTSVTLKEGWNLVPRVINGARKVFLLYGDVTPPTFVPDPKYPFTIRQADLNKGFVLAGNVIDNSRVPERVGLVWRGLDTQPIYTRPDGSRYLVVTYRFSDRAGNVAVMNFNVTII